MSNVGPPEPSRISKFGVLDGLFLQAKTFVYCRQTAVFKGAEMVMAGCHQMTSFRIVAMAVTAAALAASALLATVWLGSSANQQAPVSVASDFLAHLHANRFAEALELTSRNPLVGNSAAALQRISNQQLCGAATHFASTHPPQSNGNRLRRWLSGSEIEMPEVSVEFEGDCLLQVTLRHLPGGGWRVYSFQSHAG